MSEFLDNIREITREDDYNTILKSSMGGYTKKSVLEYLASVKEQQETLRDAYVAEVSELKKQLELLQADAAGSQEKTARIIALETERDGLLSENGTLKEERDALEKDMDEAVERIASDSAKIEKLEAELSDERARNEMAKSSSATCKLMLDAAEDKAETLSVVLRKKEEEIAELTAEKAYLTEHIAIEKVNELNDRITVLLSEAEQLQNEVTVRSAALKDREAQIAQLLEAQAAERAAMEKLQEELEARREQCEWQEGISADLSNRLMNQMEENLSLGKENSRLRAMETILKRKADMNA